MGNLETYFITALSIILVIWFWHTMKTILRNAHIQGEFSLYRSQLYRVKNIPEYFEIYHKVIPWSEKLGNVEEHTNMRDELFELIKQRKDELGIKKKYIIS